MKNKVKVTCSYKNEKIYLKKGGEIDFVRQTRDYNGREALLWN